MEWMPVTIMGDLDGVASVAVALLMVEQATAELRSSSAWDGVASVAVALLMVEQATLELKSPATFVQRSKT